MKLLGVLGNPIAHSRSPQIHHHFAKLAGLSVDYQKVLVETGCFADTVQTFLSNGALGFNITVPHKHDAFLLADRVDEAAKIARAVNTIKLEEDGSLSGFNTDGAGLVTDITKRLGWQIRDKNVLVLGAGGAVQGVMTNLLSESPASIHLYNRTESKALDLVKRLSDNRLTSLRLNQLSTGYDLIISGSSAGLSLDAGSGQDILPTSIIGNRSFCYDMIYGSQPTSFMNWCADQGAAATSDGLGMLVEQAALAFEIWFGQPVETESLLMQMRDSL